MNQPPAGPDWSSAAAEPPPSARRVPPYLSRGTAGGSAARSSEPVPPAGEPAADATAPGLRPFVITSGRVRAERADIALETQVTTRVGSVDLHAMGLSPELRSIVALCRQTVSVAEISARLGLHLGVAKILVGDLHAADIVDVHQSEKVAQHDTETIARVIRAVSAIS